MVYGYTYFYLPLCGLYQTLGNDYWVKSAHLKVLMKDLIIYCL